MEQRKDSGGSGIQTAARVVQVTNTSYMDPERQYSNVGKGLCVIMANFVGRQGNTKHLPGYLKDIESLQTLFKNELGFDLLLELGGLEFKNLSKVKFKEALTRLQTYLNGDCVTQTEHGERNKYDKFVLVVLSHGSENGILMCKDSTGETMEESQYLSVETIINHFTHDNIRSLSGVPKTFFIQACRGSDVTQTSNDSSIPRPHAEKKALRGQQPSITRANILIAYSTLERNFSFVRNEGGSWFIQQLVSVLREKSRTEDIFGIMTEVIRRISQQTGKFFFPCNEPSHEVRVSMEDTHHPVRAFGKLKGSAIRDEYGEDEVYTKEYKMLHVDGETYDGFAYEGNVSPVLKDYEFRGHVKYMQADEIIPTMPFEEWISASKLEIFKDEHHFEIFGELRPKNDQEMQPIARPGIIRVHGDRFELKNFHKPKTPMNMSTLDIELRVNDEAVSWSELEHKPAWYYIDAKSFCRGTFGQQNGVYGIYAEIYQLPVISSTLTKKFFLMQPTESSQSQAPDYTRIGVGCYEIVKEEIGKLRAESDLSQQMVNNDGQVIPNSQNNNQYVDPEPGRLQEVDDIDPTREASAKKTLTSEITQH